MTERLEKLTDVVGRFGHRLALDELLQVVTEGAAELSHAPRTNLRLLNPSRTKLLVACRSGSSLHQDPNSPFMVGEGLVGWVAQQLSPLRTGAAERDPRFVRRADMKEPMGSFLGVPLIAGTTCVGVLSAVHTRPHAFDAEDEQLLLLLGTAAAPHLDQARHYHLSSIDGLTGAQSRRAIDAALAESPDEPLAVALVDIVHLRLVNERFGYAAGDEVLRGVAQRLAASLSPADGLFRWAGEEFLCVLRSTDLGGAVVRTEKMRLAMARRPVTGAPVTVTVTLSAGVACRMARESPAQLLARAQRALEQAQQAGGNCVVSDPGD